MRNIVLVGFMGTGKTTIATKLAGILGMRYISTDDMIERQEKRTINEIFTRDGEGVFRDIEASVIARISAMEGLVIDMGGGAVIREENMAAFRSNGTIICLSADEDTIVKRTKKYKHRPLLNCDNPIFKIRRLLAERAPLYAKADYCIDTGKMTVRQTVEKILEIVNVTKGK